MSLYPYDRYEYRPKPEWNGTTPLNIGPGGVEGFDLRREGWKKLPKSFKRAMKVTGLDKLQLRAALADGHLKDLRPDTLEEFARALREKDVDPAVLVFQEPVAPLKLPKARGPQRHLRHAIQIIEDEQPPGANFHPPDLDETLRHRRAIKAAREIMYQMRGQPTKVEVFHRVDVDDDIKHGLTWTINEVAATFDISVDKAYRLSKRLDPRPPRVAHVKTTYRYIHMLQFQRFLIEEEQSETS